MGEGSLEKAVQVGIFKYHDGKVDPLEETEMIVQENLGNGIVRTYSNAGKTGFGLTDAEIDEIVEAAVV